MKSELLVYMKKKKISTVKCKYQCSHYFGLLGLILNKDHQHHVTWALHCRFWNCCYFL